MTSRRTVYLSAPNPDDVPMGAIRVCRFISLNADRWKYEAVHNGYRNRTIEGNERMLTCMKNLKARGMVEQFTPLDRYNQRTGQPKENSSK